MSSGLVICSICGHEVHQVRPGNAGWVHCDVQTPRCVGADSVYPLDKSEIVGKFCGKDAMGRGNKKFTGWYCNIAQSKVK